MIEFIFSIDYEIYGNGEGALRELVYEPARELKNIFDKTGSKLVIFVEVAELEKFEAYGPDPVIIDVKQQVKEFYQHGHEIALHLHSQWCNASYKNDGWVLDYEEYNLCTLPSDRIAEIIDNALYYLRTTLDSPDYTPISFRAGNWLFQPTEAAARALAARGIKIDSSVFKGGLQYLYKLDYRSAIGNGYFWKFYANVNTPDPKGILLEIPIYTQMVPFWKIITSKRVGLQQKGSSEQDTIKGKLFRILDRLRFRQPLKFDFCRMTITELTNMVDRIIREDEADTASFRPIVAIGHTKDLVDFQTVESFLVYLSKKGIRSSTFEEVYKKHLSIENV